MRARYYHPWLGRFISEDPIQFDGGNNWYAFANGDPVMKMDPSGKIGSGIVPTANGWVNGWIGESGTYTGLQMPTIFDHLPPIIGGIPANSKVNNVEWMMQRFPEEIKFAEASANFQIRNNLSLDAYNLQPNEFSFQGWVEGYEYGNMWIRVRNIQNYDNVKWKAEMYVTDGLGFDVGDRASMWFERYVQGPLGQIVAPSRSIERGSWEINGTYPSRGCLDIGSKI